MLQGRFERHAPHADDQVLETACRCQLCNQTTETNATLSGFTEDRGRKERRGENSVLLAIPCRKLLADDTENRLPPPPGPLGHLSEYPYPVHRPTTTPANRLWSMIFHSSEASAFLVVLNPSACALHLSLTIASPLELLPSAGFHFDVARAA